MEIEEIKSLIADGPALAVTTASDYKRASLSKGEGGLVVIVLAVGNFTERVNQQTDLGYHIEEKPSSPHKNDRVLVAMPAHTIASDDPNALWGSTAKADAWWKPRVVAAATLYDVTKYCMAYGLRAAKGLPAPKPAPVTLFS